MLVAVPVPVTVTVVELLVQTPFTGTPSPLLHTKVNTGPGVVVVPGGVTTGVSGKTPLCCAFETIAAATAAVTPIAVNDATVKLPKAVTLEPPAAAVHEDSVLCATTLVLKITAAAIATKDFFITYPSRLKVFPIT